MSTRKHSVALKMHVWTKDLPTIFIDSFTIATGEDEAVCLFSFMSSTPLAVHEQIRIAMPVEKAQFMAKVLKDMVGDWQTEPLKPKQDK